MVNPYIMFYSKIKKKISLLVERLIQNKPTFSSNFLGKDFDIVDTRPTVPCQSVLHF